MSQPELPPDDVAPSGAPDAIDLVPDSTPSDGAAATDVPTHGAVTRDLSLSAARRPALTAPLSPPGMPIVTDARRPSRRHGPRLDPLLAVILVVAGALRIFGFDWDEGTLVHPDERGILGHIMSIGLPRGWADFWSPASPLNPHFSAYGHLPFYATVIFSHVVGWLGRTVGGPLAGLAPADITNAGIIESGRVLSGLADTGTLLFVYLIGRLIFGRATALLAALLGCFTVLDLEFSHFAMVDTYLTFCVAGALYFCVRIVYDGRPRSYGWAGAWIGFALACKISAAPLLAPLLVAHVFRGAGRDPSLLPASERVDGGKAAARLPANPLLLLMALAWTAVAAFVTMPYALIDFGNWWNGVWDQLQLARGIYDSPFTRRFAGLPAYWYPLQQLVGWTMGLPLGLSAVAGVLVAVGRQVRRRHGGELVLLVWAAVFFGSTAGQYMKFLRYMLPLVPVLNIFAAALLIALWRWAGNVRHAAPAPGRALARAVAIAVVGLTILYGLAYENIYTAENTHLAATRWMVTHVPAGATITIEDWDDTLPWPPPGVTVPPYRVQTLAILGPGDGPTTVPMFVSALQTAQYITIASARVFGSVAHQPGRYPYSIRWYDLLFSGKLNFRLVKAFANHPHLGPFFINDYQALPRAGYYDHIHLWYEADENMSEYDHSPIYIFKRTGPIDPVKAETLLTDNGRLFPAVAAFDPSHTMLLPRKIEQADQKAPAYNTMFPADNPLARVPLLSWWAMIEALGLLALPLVMRVCGGALRDGGYALARLCGIIIVGYLTWLAATLHVAVYSRGLILASCLALLLLSLGLGLRPRALWAELRARRRGILWAELIFLAGFLVMSGIRMAYPDLWHFWYGGERTQELSFMNAILRSQYFPPYDPWFAGGTLNYYYYGQYLTGMLMKLTGIPVTVGFNLALPMLFALTLSIAFSIGFNATGRAWVGAMAAAMEGVLGNLGPIQQLAALNPVHSTAFLPVIAGLRDAFGGIIAVLTHQVPLRPDFFWTSSRILSISNGDAINEYPIWSFTYGDMHAHVIDIPILLGVIGLALAISGLGSGSDQDPRSSLPDHSAARGPHLLSLAALAAVVAGATGPTNLWDLPTAIVILTAGFALRGWFVAGRGGWAWVLRDVAAPGALLGLLCLILYRPFYSTVLGISSGFTFLTPHTPTDAYLLHFGLPLFLLTSFCLAVLWRRLRRFMTVLEFYAYYRDKGERLPLYARVVRAMIGRRRPDQTPPSLLSAHVAIFGLLAALGTWLAGFTTLALIAVLLTLTMATLAEISTRARLANLEASQPFALVLATLGLALTALPDIVMQNEAGRMNTFFKLYNQAWPLLAISGALALSALVRTQRRAVLIPFAGRMRRPSTAGQASVPALASALVARPPAWAAAGAGGSSYSAIPRSGDEDSPGDPTSPARPAENPPDSVGHEAGVAPTDARRPGGPRPRNEEVSVGRILWWAVLAVLVFGAALFPTFGIYSHLQIRSDWSQTANVRIPDGLDGAAFVRVLYPGDAAAIDWINSHLTGTPVLLTSDRGGNRNFAAKVTMFTGLPTIVTWLWEDQQERYSGQGRPQSQYPSAWVNQFDSGRVTWNGSQWVMNLPRTTVPALGTRSSDLETIYNTHEPQVALPLLREYHVSYIYVGIAERGDPNSDEPTLAQYGNRAGFDPAGLAKFDRMVAAGQLRLRYDRLGVKIYQVL